MEAWCAMKTATANGVRAATEADGRYTIECLHNASTTAELSSKQLIEMVLRKTPQEMRDILAAEDVNVTNARDMETMLPVVGETDDLGWKSRPGLTQARDGQRHTCAIGPLCVLGQ